MKVVIFLVISFFYISCSQLEKKREISSIEDFDTMIMSSKEAMKNLKKSFRYKEFLITDITLKERLFLQKRKDWKTLYISRKQLEGDDIQKYVYNFFSIEGEISCDETNKYYFRTPVITKNMFYRSDDVYGQLYFKILEDGSVLLGKQSSEDLVLEFKEEGGDYKKIKVEDFFIDGDPAFIMKNKETAQIYDYYYDPHKVVSENKTRKVKFYEPKVKIRNKEFEKNKKEDVMKIQKEYDTCEFVRVLSGEL